MDDKEIFEKMIEIIRPYAKNTAALESASDATHILDDLKVNSARLVDVIIKAEDVFDIEIDDDDVDEIKTLGNAVAIIKGKLAEGNR